jgi:sulfur carrier protein
MRVLLYQPNREIEIKGPKQVQEILSELKILPETVLVIRGENLTPEDEIVRDDETIEIRPVISGGEFR